MSHHDTKCYQLAKTFLEQAGSHDEDQFTILAQRIQDCIEDYIDEIGGEL